MYFIGIPLPSLVRKNIHRLCFGLAQVEWQVESDLYVHLLSIENRDEGFNLEIKEALVELDLPPFSIAFKGIYIHRSKGGRGAFWLEVDPNPALTNLNKTVERILKVLGVKTMAAPPHVLLGSFQKISPERFGDYLEAHATFSTAPFLVEAIALMACRTTPKRPIFTSLQNFPLRS